MCGEKNDICYVPSISDPVFANKKTQLILRHFLLLEELLHPLLSASHFGWVKFF